MITCKLPLITDTQTPWTTNGCSWFFVVRGGGYQVNSLVHNAMRSINILGPFTCKRHFLSSVYTLHFVFIIFYAFYTTPVIDLKIPYNFLSTINFIHFILCIFVACYYYESGYFCTVFIHKILISFSFCDSLMIPGI